MLLPCSVDVTREQELELQSNFKCTRRVRDKFSMNISWQELTNYIL